MIVTFSTILSPLLVCQYHPHTKIKGAVFFLKHFMYCKCNNTRICSDPELWRMIGTALLIDAFNSTSCGIHSLPLDTAELWTAVTRELLFAGGAYAKSLP